MEKDEFSQNAKIIGAYQISPPAFLWGHLFKPENAPLCSVLFPKIEIKFERS